MKAIINANFIDLDLSSNDKEAVIREMAGILLREDRINDEEDYVASVMKRESIESTAIGFEVGIPHGRCNAVNDATVFFGRSKEGIVWNDSGELVNLIFLLAIPEKSESDQHLKILAALARKLMDTEFIEELKSGENKEAILSSLEETFQKK